MVTKDLTKGNVIKVILMFALPMFMSSILQQFYNLTDIAIIGHVMGDDALTAIGSVSTIYGLFNSLLFGMGSGVSVVLAKYFGADDEKGMKKGVANTLILSLIWITVIISVAVTFLNKLMDWINVPGSVYATAESYIRVMLSMMFFSFAYNILSGMLRAVGNSVMPLVFLAVSVVTNIMLDLLFVAVLGLGLPGAAWATITAQALSSVVCFIYMAVKVPVFRLSRSDIKISGSVLWELFSAGISFAMMFTVVNFGTLILQSAINEMSLATIAAHTTARKISELCMMLVGTLSGSMATFAGQNHGAGRYDRIMEAWKKVLLVCFGIATFLIILIYTAGPYMVQGISGSTDPEVTGTALYYLKFDLPFYYVLAILLITRNTMQGMGAKIIPIFGSIMEFGLKLLTAKYLAVRLGYFGIVICEPLIWTVCAVFIGVTFVLLLRYRKKQLSSSVSRS